MRQEDRLKAMAGSRVPFTVPENYFESFKSNLMANLPAYPEPVKIEVSVWQKIRPYLYLAAMFAGIWCMMKIFHNVSNSANVGQPTAQTEEIIMIDNYDSLDYLASNDLEYSFDIEDEVSQAYSSIEELKKDFYSINLD